jgi:hypothetical protein
LWRQARLADRAQRRDRDRRRGARRRHVAAGPGARVSGVGAASRLSVDDSTYDHGTVQHDPTHAG